MKKKKKWCGHSIETGFWNVLKTTEKDVLKIHHLDADSLDMGKYEESFYSGDEYSANQSSNVGKKTTRVFYAELKEAVGKLLGYNSLYKLIANRNSSEDADEFIKGVLQGYIFVNDASKMRKPYCYAVSARDIAMDGMPFVDASVSIRKPKRAESFINLLIQTDAFVSDEIAGAIAFTDFFPVYDWFLRNDFGEKYLHNKEAVKVIKQQIQSICYSFNFPFRGIESPFTNLSVLCRKYLEKLFEGYFMPDQTTPNLETVYDLQILFVEELNDMYLRDGIFTFPVINLGLATDENGNVFDEESEVLFAKLNCEKSIYNILQDLPSKLSNCCRLKLDSKMMQSSIGGAGLSIGSHRIIGLNIYLCQAEGKVDKYFDLVVKGLLAHRQLIEKQVKQGKLPLLTHHIMEMRNSFSTIGHIGLWETFGDVDEDIYISKACEFMKKISDKVNLLNKENQRKGITFNIEQIPAENMAIRLAKLTHLTNKKLEKFDIFANQIVPLIESEYTLEQRIKTSGFIDKYSSGGQIVHLPYNGSKPLNPEQMLTLMRECRKNGVSMFAVNYTYNRCENGHYSLTHKNRCPFCGGKLVEEYTRVVGFVKGKNSFSEERRLESNLRVGFEL